MVIINRLNPKIYLSGAIVIGIFQIIDGFVILTGHSNNINSAFSLIELIWFFISVLFLFVYRQKHLDLLVPNLFIAYSFYGWVVGGYIILTKLPNENFLLPEWFMVTAIFFGLAYCACSAHVYYQWYILKN